MNLAGTMGPLVTAFVITEAGWRTSPFIPGNHLINRGSYMSANVLLILLNELGKRDKMRGLRSILSLFRNEFNKSNYTRARMLDSIYHMTLGLLWSLISDVIRNNFVILYATLLWTS